MPINQIVVTIHEKRNHPHEFGHYDCSVTYTAEPHTSGFDPDHVTIELRQKARAHVQAECDRWIAQIEEEHHIADIQQYLRFRLDDIARDWRCLYNARLAVRRIRMLPEHLQAESREKLREALATGKERREAHQ